MLKVRYWIQLPLVIKADFNKFAKMILSKILRNSVKVYTGSIYHWSFGYYSYLNHQSVLVHNKSTQ